MEILTLASLIRIGILRKRGKFYKILEWNILPYEIYIIYTFSPLHRTIFT